MNSGKEREDIELTNVGSLNHTDVVSPIPNTAHTFLSMRPDEASDISLLGWRTPARDHCGEFGSDLDELDLEQVQTELDGPISVASPGYESDPDLKRLSINDKATIQL